MNRFSCKNFLLAIALGALGCFSALSFAGVDEVKAAIQKRHPDVKIKNVDTTPIPGLYEVYANGQILYVTEDAAFVLVGASLIDEGNKRNLTLEKMKSLTSIKFDDLPLADAIAIKKGNGKFKFAVFTDPDCPYCKQLESGLNIQGLSNYTAYVFLFPLPSHKDAKWKAESIWCARDKEAAWRDWMLNEKLPEKVSCDNPIERNLKLGSEIGISGTPTIYLKNGTQAASLQDIVDAINMEP
jgi:thiol:disulfide interchange protein DsbC